MKRHNLLHLILLVVLSSFTLNTDKPAYKIFGPKGAETTYSKLLKAASNADIVLFGELHNNPICHWLELELAKDLATNANKKLILGAEMFEADNQKVLDSFVVGDIDEKRLKIACRLWPNFKTDYAPLVELARKEKMRFVASNIPRKFATMVYKGGFEALDTLSDLFKTWMAPLPMAYDSTLDCYKNIFAAAGGHGGQNLPKSQACKDATMAWFIMQNYKPGKLFLHFNGSYHSNNYQSIYWYLKRANPLLKIVTIASVEQSEFHTLEKDNLHLADFIICSPESMTKTY